MEQGEEEEAAETLKAKPPSRRGRKPKAVKGRPGRKPKLASVDAVEDGKRERKGESELRTP